MGDYSKYFGHHELYHSDDVPPVEAQAKLRHLAVNTLDPLREEHGSSLISTSGYRNPAHNAAVGGSGKSEHIYGEADDLADGVGRGGRVIFESVVRALKKGKLPFLGGLGLYWPENEPGSIVHVDERDKAANGGVIMTWYRNEVGVYVDLPSWARQMLCDAGVSFV